MTADELKKYILNGKLDCELEKLYGTENITYNRERYAGAVHSFIIRFGSEREVSLFSVPGRSELSGNHTDHNHGCVIASSINLDIIAVASANNSKIINITNEGFGDETVDFSLWREPDKTRMGTSASIIAGMCRGLSDSGYTVGGFDAYTVSDVLKGSGLSSSAAFEDMIGNIENYLYNDGKIDNVEIAKLSQLAEIRFFGKPCGLMDQIACAVGGIVAIDFADPSCPVITPVNFDLSAAGYKLCIVSTGGNHADLTDDYASIPTEMKLVAACLGESVLRDSDESKLIAAIPELRKKTGDRGVLRSLHFFEENKRVKKQTAALLAGDLPEFLRCATDSGRSSFCYLQNIYSIKDVTCQGLSLALCLSDIYLSGKNAAWRVHGGGFAGTILAFVPDEVADGFREFMDSAFGEGACLNLNVRMYGAVRVK